MMELWNNLPTPRLILGTVQLGMPYGIANDSGMPDRAAACAIVESALRNGIRHFDTAQAYGASESALGEALAQLGVSGEVSITTKLSAALNPLDATQVRGSIEESLERLKVGRLWCLMLHDPAWLVSWEAGLRDVLREQQALGRVNHLGVSLRTPEDAPAALACRDIAIIQAPCNAWDRRMAERGHLAASRQLGKLCCVRSIYLQGLLTMPPDRVRARLPRAEGASARWWDLANEFGVSVKELAMRYALALGAPLVVGAESVTQLEETVALASLEPLPPDALARIAEAMDPLVSEEILEPFRWERN
ncbi:MAG: aldo/keto reductase [Candidatus Hydrogenedentes bacterium]|nr:aldo/keto reductase [Candidatus Hydrogenedentota bacterium]